MKPPASTTMTSSKLELETNKRTSMVMRFCFRNSNSPGIEATQYNDQNEQRRTGRTRQCNRSNTNKQRSQKLITEELLCIT